MCIKSLNLTQDYKASIYLIFNYVDQFNIVLTDCESSFLPSPYLFSFGTYIKPENHTDLSEGFSIYFSKVSLKYVLLKFNPSRRLLNVAVYEYVINLNMNRFYFNRKQAVDSKQNKTKKERERKRKNFFK